MPHASCTAVVGLQWGDEGKGKIVDLLARDHDLVVRYNGGANAGHSVVVEGERYAVHLMPSGILYPGVKAVIANGVVVDPAQLCKEIDGLEARGVDTGGLIISDRAHVVMPYHKAEDAYREEAAADAEIGTTKRGIGPCYAEKVQRAAAIRMRDLLDRDTLRAKVELASRLREPLLGALDVDGIVDEAAAFGERLGPSIQDTTYLLHESIRDGQRVLFEGANATLLDVDHGTYPFVTGSSTTALGIGPGSGVPVTNVGTIIGVMKAYSTRVGAGPFPTELHDAVGDGIRERGREFGTTTGRPRRVGWLDLVAVRYAVMINGVTSVALTLLDVLSGMDEIRVCTAYEVDGQRTERYLPDASVLSRVTPVYETLPGFGADVSEVRDRGDLPAEASAYVSFIEAAIGVPVDLIGVGPDRSQTIATAAIGG